MDAITLALAKDYVNDTVNGLGAVKGAAATIESITPVDGGNEVVFAWTGNDGTKQTETMFVPNGNDELEDIRTGYDGYTHENAGTAVRSVGNDLIQATGVQVARFYPNKYIESHNSTINFQKITKQEGFAYAILDVTEGEKVRLKTFGGNGARAYAFADADGNNLEKADRDTNYDTVLVTPPNATKLLIHTKNLAETFAYKGTSVPDLIKQVNKQDSYISFGSYKCEELTIYYADANTMSVQLSDTGNLKSYIIPAERNKRYRIVYSGKRNRTTIAGVVGTNFRPGLRATFLTQDSTETDRETIFEYENTAYDYFVCVVANKYAELNATVTYEVSELENGFIIKGIPFMSKSEVLEMPQIASSYYVSGAKVGVAASTTELYAMYDSLVSNYPHYVTKNELGNGLFEYVFSTGNYNHQVTRRNKDSEIIKPVVLIVTGIHGSEESSVMSTYQFFADMCDNQYHLFDLRENITFKVIPCGSPTAYNNHTRLNGNSVNINRNFDVNWTLTEVGMDYSGASPADQPETQIIQNWIDSNQNASLYIDFHNSGYADEVSYLAGNSNIENMPVLKKAFLQGVYDVAPYFEAVQSFDRNLIMAYSGDFNFHAMSYRYAESKGILAVCLECSENQNNTGEDSALTIKTGAECLGNMLVSVRNRTDLLV